MPVIAEVESGGRLLTNLLHFGRLLRRMGMKVSTDQIRGLAEGLTLIDLAQREDFYHAARCFLVTDPADLELFDRAFNLFWCDQDEWLIELGVGQRKRRQASNDEAQLESDQAILGRNTSCTDENERETPQDTAVNATYSPVEILRNKDFANFTEQELQAAQLLIEGLVWRLGTRLTRRQMRAIRRTTSLDLPQVIRRSMKHGGEIVRLAWRQRKLKPRPLVVICDISGSMERYSRVLLRFLYTLAQEINRVEAFVFGTRLTRITHPLRHGQVDVALDRVSELVVDWSGGTRIGESLKTFNFVWGRRVLRGGAVVIIISDGWDRGDIALLECEMARLRRSAYRLIWLNPLLGAPDYQPLARGIRAALPYVDDFLPLHNLASLENLASLLGSLDLTFPRAW